jgi:hypothetical protein
LWDEDEVLAKARSGIPSGFFVLGFPWSLEDCSRMTSKWSLVSLMLDLIEGLDQTPMPRVRFGPGWREEDFSGSVEGMSGGPVCLFVGTEFYIFGVQSEEVCPRRRPKYLHAVATVPVFQAMLDGIERDEWPLDEKGTNCSPLWN